MKTMKIFLMIAAIPLLVGSALSQEAGSGNTMNCTTTDGIITVKGNTVEMRDYKMTVESVERDGVIRLADNANNVTAVLDTRDPNGLYLAISEGDVNMQVVAPKEAMAFSVERNYSNAAAPASPETDVARELYVAYGTEAITAASR